MDAHEAIERIAVVLRTVDQECTTRPDDRDSMSGSAIEFIRDILSQCQT